MTIKFSREEAAEILKQHVREKFLKHSTQDIQAAIYCPDSPTTEITIEVWDEEVEG